MLYSVVPSVVLLLFFHFCVLKAVLCRSVLCVELCFNNLSCDHSLQYPDIEQILCGPVVALELM